MPASRRPDAAPDTTAMARAQVILAFGPPDAMRWEDWPVPDPGPGEVRLRHTTIGVNFADLYHRGGVPDPCPVPPCPVVIGFEAAGIVEGVGEGVESFATGDRVCYGILPLGSHAQVRNYPADKLLHLPDGLQRRVPAEGRRQGARGDRERHDPRRDRADPVGAGRGTARDPGERASSRRGDPRPRRDGALGGDRRRLVPVVGVSGGINAPGPSTYQTTVRSPQRHAIHVSRHAHSGSCGMSAARRPNSVRGVEPSRCSS